MYSLFAAGALSMVVSAASINMLRVQPPEIEAPAKHYQALLHRIEFLEDQLPVAGTLDSMLHFSHERAKEELHSLRQEAYNQRSASGSLTELQREPYESYQRHQTAMHKYEQKVENVYNVAISTALASIGLMVGGAFTVIRGLIKADKGSN